MSHLLIQGDASRIGLPDASVDLVLGSPPYADCRLYLEGGRDLGIARGLEAWVTWMLRVTAEALRVSRGAVVWVAAGKTKDRNYWPACEALMADWFRRKVGSGLYHDGIEVPLAVGSMYRPCYWRRVGIAGSGGDQWFRADVEYAMCFKRPGPLPWTDSTACGHPPKWGPNGAMSHRVKDGHRRNQWGKHMNNKLDARLKDGSYSTSLKPSHFVPAKATPTAYVMPTLANPGNYLEVSDEDDDDRAWVIDVPTGGGHMGNALASDNEAPFPEGVAEFFIKSLSPPGGIVADFFSGSATTCAVADRLGRHGIGGDLRFSQAQLGRRRIAAGQRPVSRLDPRPAYEPLDGQLSFLDALESTP